MEIIYRNKNSLNGELIDYSQPEAVRAMIRRDAYDDQSYGLCQIWTTLGWTNIQRWPITMLAIAEKQYVHKNGEWEDIMKTDLRTLIDFAHSHIAHINRKSAGGQLT